MTKPMAVCLAEWMVVCAGNCVHLRRAVAVGGSLSGLGYVAEWEAQLAETSREHLHKAIEESGGRAVAVTGSGPKLHEAAPGARHVEVFAI